jgi:hypothetical protein
MTEQMGTSARALKAAETPAAVAKLIHELKYQARRADESRPAARIDTLGSWSKSKNGFGVTE